MSGPSAADVRSILSIPSASTSSQPKKSTVKKPEGISRELYSLIGPSAPTLAAQLTKPRLKQKPNLGGNGKVKWSVFLAHLGLHVSLYSGSRREWQTFRNGARSDGLRLGHWVKAGTDPDAGTPLIHLV